MTSVAATGGDHADDLPSISPELVLVDPELSRRVRARVPLLFRRRKPPLPVLHLLPDTGLEPADTVSARGTGPSLVD